MIVENDCLILQDLQMGDGEISKEVPMDVMIHQQAEREAAREAKLLHANRNKPEGTSDTGHDLLHATGHCPGCADSVDLVLFITYPEKRRGSHWKEKIVQTMLVLSAALPLVTSALAATESDMPSYL